MNQQQIEVIVTTSTAVISIFKASVDLTSGQFKLELEELLRKKMYAEKRAMEGQQESPANAKKAT